MKAMVRTAFTLFQAKWEGVCAWMYLDTKCLVTTAIGLLIDSVSDASVLPWKNVDGSPATLAQISHEWNVVKAKSGMSILGGMAFQTVTSLRLTPADIDALTLRRADAFEAVLRQRFTEWDTWPADAQLGCLSLAWPEGPYFFTHFPKFDVAADRLDFGVCADESSIPGGAYMGRNAADKVLFNNAAAVLMQQLDPEVLYWPRVL